MDERLTSVRNLWTSCAQPTIFRAPETSSEFRIDAASAALYVASCPKQLNGRNAGPRKRARRNRESQRFERATPTHRRLRSQMRRKPEPVTRETGSRLFGVEIAGTGPEVDGVELVVTRASALGPSVQNPPRRAMAQIHPPGWRCGPFRPAGTEVGAGSPDPAEEPLGGARRKPVRRPAGSPRPIGRRRAPGGCLGHLISGRPEWLEDNAPITGFGRLTSGPKSHSGLLVFPGTPGVSGDSLIFGDSSE